MTPDPRRFALAVGIVTAVAWLACSAAVGLAPGITMTITGHMVHADLSHVAWSLTWGGVLTGLVSWTVSLAAAAWFLTWTYNALVARGPRR